MAPLDCWKDGDDEIPRRPGTVVVVWGDRDMDLPEIIPSGARTAALRDMLKDRLWGSLAKSRDSDNGFFMNIGVLPAIVDDKPTTGEKRKKKGHAVAVTVHGACDILNNTVRTFLFEPLANPTWPQLGQCIRIGNPPRQFPCRLNDRLFICVWPQPRVDFPPAGAMVLSQHSFTGHYYVGSASATDTFATGYLGYVENQDATAPAPANATACKYNAVPFATVLRPAAEKDGLVRVMLTGCGMATLFHHNRKGH